MLRLSQDRRETKREHPDDSWNLTYNSSSRYVRYLYFNHCHTLSYFSDNTNSLVPVIILCCSASKDSTKKMWVDSRITWLIEIISIQGAAQ